MGEFRGNPHSESVLWLFIPSGKECGEEEFYGELIKRKELASIPRGREVLRDRKPGGSEGIRTIHLESTLTREPETPRDNRNWVTVRPATRTSL